MISNADCKTAVFAGRLRVRLRDCGQYIQAEHAALLPLDPSYPTNAAVSYVVSSSLEMNLLFTARARAGWSIANWVFYGTAGLAATDLTVSKAMYDTSMLRGNSKGRCCAAWACACQRMPGGRPRP